VNPQTIDFDHGRPLSDPLEKQAFRLLNSLQLRIRLETQPLAERFGDDNLPRFIDSDFDTMYHQKWQKGRIGRQHRAKCLFPGAYVMPDDFHSLFANRECRMEL
jgi:hypothetical protein